jgi:hypothetical protein
VSHEVVLWRRSPHCALSDSRIFALLSEDIEVPELAPLDAERVATRLDAAFPGWRSDEDAERYPFCCTLDDRMLVVETFSSTPGSVYVWLERLAAEEGLVAFNPQAATVSKADVAYARRQAKVVRAAERAERLRREIEELGRQAAAGDVSAQCELGNRYSFGEGVEPDLAEAFRWYAVAAENGSADGMFNLASCYLRGDGVQRDANAAIAWYTKAAERERMAAPFALGEIYLTGDAVPRDNDTARAFFDIARDNGHPDAAAALRMLSEPVITDAMKRERWKFWSR